MTFAQHQSLAAAWCRWLGQRGTEKQALETMYRLTAEELIEQFTARGIPLPIGCEPQQQEGRIA